MMGSSNMGMCVARIAHVRWKRRRSRVRPSSVEDITQTPKQKLYDNEELYPVTRHIKPTHSTMLQGVHRGPRGGAREDMGITRKNSMHDSSHLGSGGNERRLVR